MAEAYVLIKLTANDDDTGPATVEVVPPFLGEAEVDTVLPDYVGLFDGMGEDLLLFVEAMNEKFLRQEAEERDLGRDMTIAELREMLIDLFEDYGFLPAELETK